VYKNIDLPVDTLQKLSIMTAVQGRSLKNIPPQAPGKWNNSRIIYRISGAEKLLITHKQERIERLRKLIYMRTFAI